jgi:rubredoxin
MTKTDMAKTDMATAHAGDIPRQNPCAQCGAPIPKPDWIEPGEGRVSYLWNCRACGYRFEAVAIFDEEAIAHPPLAA